MEWIFRILNGFCLDEVYAERVNLIRIMGNKQEGNLILWKLEMWKVNLIFCNGSLLEVDCGKSWKYNLKLIFRAFFPDQNSLDVKILLRFWMSTIPWFW